MDDREKLIALLVEAESLCAAIDCYDGAVCEYDGEIGGCAAFRADHLIANGVVVRERGEWRNNKDEYPECTRCGYMPQYDPMIDDIYYSDFCPHCGSDMRGAVNDG